jgi:RNA polymerase sigma factor for flagellar operon FliA
MLEAAIHPNLDPEFQRYGLSSLEQAFRDCETRMGRPATNLEVCYELGMSLQEFYSLLDLYRGVGLGRVDDLESYDGDRKSEPRVKYVPDPVDQGAFHIYPKSRFQIAMAQALESLPKNEKLVVSLRHNKDLTMLEIARIFGISEARIAQIYTAAMLRVRGKLQSLDVG